MYVKDVMDEHVLTVREETTVKETLALISRYDIRNFPVVNGEGKFVGMVYEQHLLQALYPRADAFSDGFPDYSQIEEILEHFKDVPISKIMTVGVKHLSDNDYLLSAGTRMMIHNVAVMPVLKDEEVAGMISQSQIFKYLMGRMIKAESESKKDSRGLSDKAPVPVESAKDREKKSGPENRFYRRVEMKIPLAYKTANARGEPVSKGQGRIGVSVNVSAGGMLIQTEEEVKKNTLLDIAADLFQNNKPFVRLCRVMRSEEDSEEKGKWLIGVMFLAMSIKEHQKIDEYLDRF